MRAGVGAPELDANSVTATSAVVPMSKTAAALRHRTLRSGTMLGCRMILASAAPSNATAIPSQTARERLIRMAALKSPKRHANPTKALPAGRTSSSCKVTNQGSSRSWAA